MWARAATFLLWRTLAVVSLGLGGVGVFVPGLPTVPFLLVAAWAGGKGWPALEIWLIEHPRYGPAIRRWRERGVVPRRAKWMSSSMMLVSAAMLWLLPAPGWLKVVAPATMAAVAIWLWRRPEA